LFTIYSFFKFICFTGISDKFACFSRFGVFTLPCNFLKMKAKVIVYSLVWLMAVTACTEAPEGNVNKTGQKPQIEPDYSEVTIPKNIAPLNFLVKEKGDAFYVKITGKGDNAISVSSSEGIIKIPEKEWKNLLAENTNSTLKYQVFVKQNGNWNAFNAFENSVADAPVAPYLYYRLLYPGYESWTEISIVQRNLGNFDEHAVVENNVVDQNCVNCHSFNQKNPGNFLFHMRGSMGGTYFLSNGKLKKVNLKTREMDFGAVYPRWHPTGKYVAFSSNKIVQRFHAVENKKIEVSDLASSLVLYDVDKNEIMDIPLGDKKLYMDTYPEWSPDGNYLYFCRAPQIEENYDYRDIKYNLYRVNFNPETRKFGEPSLVFDAAAIGKSASFPRISPDGNTLVVTVHNYGCFPIWHKEADLYAVHLSDFSVSKMKVNSDFTDSYHSWSSNGRWLVFSSKRGDGLTARPYIAYIDKNGKARKPFVLPQKDPTFYNHFIKTFNIPEFAEADVALTPGEVRDAAEKEAIQAKWSNN